MRIPRRTSTTVAWITTVFLVFSTLSPAWAGSHAQGSATAAGDHAPEHVAARQHQHAAPATADPADTVAATGGFCTQHQTCQGNCCVGCALCGLALPGAPVFSSSSHPVFYSVVHRLHPGGSVHSLDRPPRG